MLSGKKEQENPKLRSMKIPRIGQHKKSSDVMQKGGRNIAAQN